MEFKIIYNANSENWYDGEGAIMFVKSEINYLTEFYRIRGYLYLEKVYDAFGIKWNPYEDNVCWVYEQDGELNIKWSVDAISKSIIDYLFDCTICGERFLGDRREYLWFNNKNAE